MKRLIQASPIPGPWHKKRRPDSAAFMEHWVLLLRGPVDPEPRVPAQPDESQPQPGHIVRGQAAQGFLVEEAASAGAWLTNPVRNPRGSLSGSIQILATPGAA